MGTATRAAIVVTAVAVLMNTVIDLGSSGFYATFGVFILLVLSDFGGPLTTRFYAYAATGAVGLVLIVVGAVAAMSLAATIAVTVAVVFALSYAVVLRGHVSAAYLSLLLPYIVAVTTPQTMSTLPASLAAYAGGALTAAITAVALWPSRPVSQIRQAAGRAVTAAARVLDARRERSGAVDEADADDMQGLIGAYRDLHAVYDGKLKRPGHATAQDRSLVRLVDDVGRLRYALDRDGGEHEPMTTADAHLLQATTAALDACGTAISANEPLAGSVVDELYDARERHMDALPRTADRLMAEGRTGDLVSAAHAGFHVRILSSLAAMVVRHTSSVLPGHGSAAHRRGTADPLADEIERIDSASAPLDLLRANATIDSPWFRRALQLAVAATIAVTVIYALHLSTGFWVILGVVSALQLSAIHSRRSALQVAVGTVSGFLVCAILVRFVGSDTALLISLLPVVAFVTVWYPSGRFEVPLKQAGFTVWFVMLVSLSQHGMSMRIDDVRIVDVGVGLATSLLITTFLWPRGVAARVQQVLESSVRSTAHYVAAAYTYVSSAMTADDAAEIDRAARAAAEGRTRAVEAYDVALSQGGDIGRGAGDWATVNNAVDHAFIVGTMVRGLHSYGLAPLPNADVAAELTRSARQSAEAFAAMIAGSDGSLGGPAPTGRRAEHSESIRLAVDSWAGQADAVTFTIAPEVFSMSPGRAGVSLLWAQDWLRYFQWMAAHSSPEGSVTVSE
ncbi:MULTISPECIES: FUSC family protein [Gordonia]|uniref:FUSC family protein n=1 Tax=Gordonia TaxID=2053 RepID=UPI0032640004